jgi:hypothetical protein
MDFLRLLRLSYDRNGKQYHRDQDWHRSFLHCTPRFERYLSRG